MFRRQGEHQPQSGRDDVQGRKSHHQSQPPQPSVSGAGFRHDTNKITLIDRTGGTAYPLKQKSEVAADIVDRLAECISNSTNA